METTTPITLATAGYSSLECALQDYDAVWDARQEGTFHHSSLAVLGHGADGVFRIERDDSTARFLTWGGALLGGALCALLPWVRVWTAPSADLAGRGAMIRHFHRRFGVDGLAAAAGLLDDSRYGLVVVVVNRRTEQVAPLLEHAKQVHVMDTVWGDLEEELGRDLVRARPELVLVVG